MDSLAQVDYDDFEAALSAALFLGTVAATFPTADRLKDVFVNRILAAREEEWPPHGPR
ncbi:hypothetical protein HQ576_13950 [bacterium]|nr:hypothetical protein [bacterium]